MRHTLLLITCLCLPATTLAASAINRCVDASGNTVFTDRDCSQHGARDMPRAGVAQATLSREGAGWSGTHGLVSGGLPNPRMGCAADPGELAMRLRVALESRDVNQLSSLYHWPGASSRGAESIMTSLARTAAKGVYAVEPEPVAGANLHSATAMSVASTAAVAPPARGLRVQHGPGGFEGYPPETTHFPITRHMGCWWIYY